mmetsp:Transcript_11008/g.25690  ORF Transcript_11008/g.25690 Transcript_11008/m.25690 type:complete len:206 (-) Transcript_11008:653-1270(-)
MGERERERETECVCWCRVRSNVCVFAVLCLCVLCVCFAVESVRTIARCSMRSLSAAPMQTSPPRGEGDSNMVEETCSRRHQPRGCASSSTVHVGRHSPRPRLALWRRGGRARASRAQRTAFVGAMASASARGRGAESGSRTRSMSPPLCATCATSTTRLPREKSELGEGAWASVLVSVSTTTWLHRGTTMSRGCVSGPTSTTETR